MKYLFLFILICNLGLVHAGAQEGWFQSNRARVASALAEQPTWAAPLVTVAPRLEEGFRADFVRQSITDGQSNWNYGNTKGLQVVPFRRIELRVSPPPFLTHSSGVSQDGFGDVAFRLKYLVYASGEKHRNAVASAFVGASVPTGKNGNGSCCAILSPTLIMGKGIGHLVLTTSAGGSLPVSNVAKLGQQITWNNAVQLHATRLLWLQAETNSTFYRGGKQDGKQQTFLTPGLIVSRIPLGRASIAEPLALSLGIGEQIAVTHYNTYNHSPIFTVRLRF